MKRPIVLVVMAILHGELTSSEKSGWLLTFVLVIIFLGIMAYVGMKKKFLYMLAYAISFLFGIFLMKNEEQLFDVLDSIPEGEEVFVEGKVKSIAKSEYDYKVILNIDNNVDYLIVFECEPEFAIGNSISIKGVNKKLKTPANKGNFDEKSYYYRLGIGIKVKAENYEVFDDSQNKIISSLLSLRDNLIINIKKSCDEEEAGCFIAMLYGDKASLDNEIKSLYSDSGIAHILAISGLHISLIGMFLYKGLRKVLGYKVSGIASTLFMIAFGIMSGGSVSTIRAIIMFGVKLFSQVTGRVYDTRTSLAIAGGYLIIDNPYNIYNTGFQLSFGAIIAILYLVPAFEMIINTKNKIIEAFIVSISVNIITMPILSFTFFEIPSYSAILNIVVIPLMSIVLISGLLSSIIAVVSVGLAQFFIGAGVYVLRLYKALCSIFTRIPQNKIIVGKMEISEICLYYVLVVIFIVLLNITGRKIYEHKKMRKMKGEVRKGFYKYIIASLIMIIFIYFNVYKDRLGKSYVTFLDVGQGDSAFVVSNNGGTYLFDGGSSSVKNVAKNRIIPYLKSMGCSKLDFIVLSHNDSDHINGIIDIISEGSIEIGTVVIPLTNEGFEDIISLANESDIDIAYAKQGTIINEEGFSIDFISPNTYVDANESSLVALIRCNDKKLLFTGDIGIETEEVLLRNNMLMKVDILKVAHHGSKYSSKEEFIKMVNPIIAIMSCGEGNSYGHPHKETLDRFNGLNIESLITYETGQVTINLDFSETISYNIFR